MSHFFDIVKSEQKGKDISSEAEFDKLMKKALEIYKKDIMEKNLLADLNEEYMQELHKELESTRQTKLDFENQATNAALFRMRFAFLTCFG